jgi:hypothetical protein
MCCGADKGPGEVALAVACLSRLLTLQYFYLGGETTEHHRDDRPSQRQRDQRPTVVNVVVHAGDVRTTGIVLRSVRSPAADVMSASLSPHRSRMAHRAWLNAKSFEARKYAEIKLSPAAIKWGVAGLLPLRQPCGLLALCTTRGR